MVDDGTNNRPVLAEDLDIGDNVTVAGSSATVVSIVPEAASTGLAGKHAPLTMDGTLIVNDVLVSAYMYAGHRGVSWGSETLITGHTASVLAHAPLRLIYRVYPAIGLPEWHTKQGQHMWTQMLIDNLIEANTPYRIGPAQPNMVLYGTYYHI